MQWLGKLPEYLNNLSVYSKKIGFGDILEIVLIAILVYALLVWMKNSRARVLIKGLVVIFVFWMFAYFMEMHTVLWIAQNLLGFAVTAVIVVLQPELRKGLEDLGTKNIIASVLPFGNSHEEAGVFNEKSVNEIARACQEMSRAKTGALIVIEQDIPLQDYQRTGIDVDAVITSQLLINIFEHNTPLHDGAVLIRKNRVASATCYLPLTENNALSKELGTRHRAGVGISEVTDSLTVIVSEETGAISAAYNGSLSRNLSADELKSMMSDVLIRKTDEAKNKRIWKGRSKTGK